MSVPPNRPTTEEIAREIIMRFYNCGFEAAPSVVKEMNAIKEALDKIVEEKDISWGREAIKDMDTIKSLEAEIAQRKDADKEIQSAYKRLVNIFYPMNGLKNPFGVGVFRECEKLAIEKIHSLEAEVKRLTGQVERLVAVGTDSEKYFVVKNRELQASLSLAAEALNKIAKLQTECPFDGSGGLPLCSMVAAEALQSPAIQKEVQRIEAMEKCVEAASEAILSTRPDGTIHPVKFDNLCEAIKAYEKEVK